MQINFSLWVFFLCLLLQVFHAIGSFVGFAHYSFCFLMESIRLKNVLSYSLFPSRICNSYFLHCEVRGIFCWVFFLRFFFLQMQSLTTCIHGLHEIGFDSCTIPCLAPCEQQVLSSRIQGLRKETGCKYQCNEKAEDIMDEGIVFANKFLCICLALLNKKIWKN